jgi:hypothetical protein
VIANRERVVVKDDLIATVWNGRIVSESAITTCINAARSVIGDRGDTQRMTAAGNSGNAASRVDTSIQSKGAYTYGGYPDIDELFQRQATERDLGKREALLHKIQQLTFEQAMFAPVMDLRTLNGCSPPARISNSSSRTTTNFSDKQQRLFLGGTKCLVSLVASFLRHRAPADWLPRPAAWPAFWPPARRPLMRSRQPCTG